MKRPTLDSLIKDLEKVKRLAIDEKHFTGAISAINSQAKLLGLDTGKAEQQEAQPVKIVVNVADGKRYTDDNINRQPDGSFFIKH